MTTTKLSWSRDGDQWVAKLGGREARITEWVGALGTEFLVQIDGKGRGGSGGGTRSGALKRAKATAAELLAAPAKPPAKPLADGETEDEMEQRVKFVTHLCGL